MTREERVLFIVFSRTQRTYIFSWKADADSHVLKTPLVSGLEEQVDSYSAVYTVAGGSDTQLADLLQAQAIDRVYVAGLALDYCVKFTAIDLQTKLIEYRAGIGSPPNNESLGKILWAMADTDTHEKAEASTN